MLFRHFGSLRSTLYALGGLIASYVILIEIVQPEQPRSSRFYYVLDRTAWHNATARPPVVLVFVVLGWSIVVRRCRRAGMRLEQVLGPGAILPARALFRSSVILLNVVLVVHLVHFVIEHRAGASQPWYLVCDALLHVLIIGLFLSPPALASSMSRRPSDFSLELLKDMDDSDEDGLSSSPSKGVLYPEARASLARAVRDALCSPFAPVTFWHVIVADYATSLAKALGDFQITSCVAASAFRGNASDLLQSSSDDLYELYKPDCVRSPANAFALGLPFYCRLAQCLHVYYHTRERKNLVNALKYCSAFPLVIAGYVQKHSTDQQQLDIATKCLVTAAIINSSFSFGWDVVMDWGLLTPRRPAIILGSFSRFTAICCYLLLLAFNLTMRFAWAIAVFSQTSTLEYGMFVLEAVEVLRRTVWAIFRIEWEYISKKHHVQQKAVQLSSKITNDSDDLSGNSDTEALLHRSSANN